MGAFFHHGKYCASCRFAFSSKICRCYEYLDASSTISPSSKNAQFWSFFFNFWGKMGDISHRGKNFLSAFFEYTYWVVQTPRCAKESLMMTQANVQVHHFGYPFDHDQLSALLKSTCTSTMYNAHSRCTLRGLWCTIKWLQIHFTCMLYTCNGTMYIHVYL